MSDKLALHGGKPILSKKLPPSYPGALMINHKEIDEVLNVLKSKSLFRYYGPNPLYTVEKFEQEFSSFIGTNYALAVSSGTASLFVSLKAMGIGRRDKVIVPGYTWISTPLTVVENDAVPVVCSIDESLNIDPYCVREKVEEDDKIKAVIPVHMRGAPCEMDKIMHIAEEYQLMVLEDVAQSCGGAYKGKKLGSYGHMGAFSFQLNKIITSGEGGAITTSDEELYRNAVAFHDVAAFFRDPERIPPKPGLNFKIDEVRAAILHVQLKKIGEIISRMKKVKKIIRGYAEKSGLKLREINDEDGDTAAAIIFLLNSEEEASWFRKALSAEGVPCYKLYDTRHPYDAHIWVNWRPIIGDRLEVFVRDGEKVTSLLSRCVEITLNPLITVEDAELIGKAIEKVSGHIP